MTQQDWMVVLADVGMVVWAVMAILWERSAKHWRKIALDWKELYLKQARSPEYETLAAEETLLLLGDQNGWMKVDSQALARLANEGYVTVHTQLTPKGLEKVREMNGKVAAK